MKKLIILVMMLAAVTAYSAEKKKNTTKSDDKSSSFKCEGKTKCAEMKSCDEAYFYLNKCGVTRLDRDKDGVPCESICN